MSRHAFDPDCPDCRPCLIDIETGQPVAPDDPNMKPVNAAWEAASREEQEAFHQFTILNSREPLVLERMAALQERIRTFIAREKGDASAN